MEFKRLVKKRFGLALKPHGFKQDGNYFRRTVKEVLQAIWLQPSRHGGQYYPTLLITFLDVAPQRTNSMDSDCHLSVRLFSLLPDDMIKRQDSREITEDLVGDDGALLDEFLTKAVPVALDWFRGFPSSDVAREKMMYWRYAGPVSRHVLFHDLGLPVPVPVTEAPYENMPLRDYGIWPTGLRPE
jgi:hypothetical protein